MSDTEQRLTLRLPTDVHGTVVETSDPTGEIVRVVVLWADWPSAFCPRCGEPTGFNAECPVTLRSDVFGGELCELPEQHGCGEVRQTDWDGITCGTDVSVVKDEVTIVFDDEFGRADAEAFIATALRYAERLAETLRIEIKAERDKVRERLAEQLADARARLREAAREKLEMTAALIAEICTGSDVEPGVMLDPYGERLVAWDFDPAGRDVEGVSVSVSVSPEERPAASL